MKQRLDVELLSRSLVKSRAQAQEYIAEGNVKVNGQRQRKSSTKVGEEDTLEVIEHSTYVSRGGLKLEKALEEFSIDTNGKNCLDAGASTGGFTDVLLQQGARHVWAVDVGHGQLSEKISKDPRVSVKEGYNVRNMSTQDLGGAVDIVVADLSFISLTLVVEPLAQVLKTGGDMVLLIKPQFEVGKEKLAHTGVVTSQELRDQAIKNVLNTAAEHQLHYCTIQESPIRGVQGNIEYLVHFKKTL